MEHDFHQTAGGTRRGQMTPAGYASGADVPSALIALRIAWQPFECAPSYPSKALHRAFPPATFPAFNDDEGAVSNSLNVLASAARPPA
jgi:hypothetical protein